MTKKVVFALIVLVVSLAISTVAEAQSIFWCSARSPFSADVFKRSGTTVEEAKIKSRTACSDRYARCEVTQCWEESIYRYSCHAARRGMSEQRLGGYRVQSNSVELAARRVVDQCEQANGFGQCAWLCYPNTRAFVAVPAD